VFAHYFDIFFSRKSKEIINNQSQKKTNNLSNSLFLRDTVQNCLGE
jgi:hypothetical protein